MTPYRRQYPCHIQQGDPSIDPSSSTSFDSKWSRFAYAAASRLSRSSFSSLRCCQPRPSASVHVLRSVVPLHGLRCAKDLLPISTRHTISPLTLHRDHRPGPILTYLASNHSASVGSCSPSFNHYHGARTFFPSSAHFRARRPPVSGCRMTSSIRRTDLSRSSRHRETSNHHSQ